MNAEKSSAVVLVHNSNHAPHQQKALETITAVRFARRSVALSFLRDEPQAYRLITTSTTRPV
jgi:hypothetical protein